MPVVTTYPGVYIEELPSGNHTVTGVATSITAFVGRANSGPVNEPMTIFSFGDYERFFGGLGADHPMSFAVFDFFLNGGAQAVIVRLYGSPKFAEAMAAFNTKAATATSVADVTKALTDTQTQYKDTEAGVPLQNLVTKVGQPAATDPKAVTAEINTYASGQAAMPDQSEWDTAWAKEITALAPVIDDNKHKLPADLLKDLRNAAANAPAGAASNAAGQVLASVNQLAKDPANATLAPLVAALKTQVQTLKSPVLLPLQARNPGTWGRYLSATIDRANPLQPTDPVFMQKFGRYDGVTPADLFNLTVTYRPPTGQPVSERFANISLKGGDKAPFRYDRVLTAGSRLVQAVDGLDFSKLSPPSETTVTFDAASGDDCLAVGASSYLGDEATKTGIYALNRVDLFNLLCIPPDQLDGDTDPLVYAAAAALCQARRAFLIIDPPAQWADSAKQGQITALQPTDLEVGGDVGRYAAVYFPRVAKEDPTMEGQVGVFPACGIIAGIMAATDVARGVWKAPAGQNAGINGIVGLEVNLSDAENGVLNPLGINCLRNFPVFGSVVWGARTLRGADQLSDDYKYVSVRRLTNYIEESVYRATKWAVFEPNDERLWSSLRLSIGAFMANLGRQGAFYSYNVACDSKTTSVTDIEQGIVRVLVSFAPVDPAEFVVISIQQQAPQLS